MSKKMTPEVARAYLADESNFWPNDELCYVCGDEFDSLSTEYNGKIFCRDKCCREYMRVVSAAHPKARTVRGESDAQVRPVV